MNCDYGYAKLQSINGNEYLIKNFPLILQKQSQLLIKKEQEKQLDLSQIESMEISKKCSIEPNLIGIINYDYEKEEFYLINGCRLSINEAEYDMSPIFHESIQYLHHSDKAVSKYKLSTIYRQNIIPLKDLTRLHVHCINCDIPHVYFFVLPKSQVNHNLDFSIKLTASNLQLNQQKNYLNPRNKLPDIESTMKWSIEEKEYLKRSILSYGYGRWKKIKKEKLKNKNHKEVIGFSNAFLRCLVDNLPQDCNEVQNFLLGIIEEQADDIYIAPNNKDWEIMGQSPRAVPWGRRIQLLYRIRVLIKKFKKKQQIEQNMDQNTINWSTLLNFIPDQILMGQRPSVWWSRQHDIDLLRGIYKFGYANYTEIRECTEYSFYQQEQNNIYNDFPSSDNSTRRLKKLMQAIMRVENERGKLNFEMEQCTSNSLEGWTKQELSLLFQFLNSFGIPINHDNKSNWTELREKFYQFSLANHIEINKSQTQIEKIVCHIRSKCNFIINQKSAKTTTDNNNTEEQKQDELLDISQEEAFNFTKTTNLLHQLRKSYLNKEDLIRKSQDALIQKNNEMIQQQKDWIVFNIKQYDLLKSDEIIFKNIIENGFDCHIHLQRLEEFKNIDENLLKQRIRFLSEFLKVIIQQNNQKNKKVNKNMNMSEEQQLKKKVKVEIKRDENNNIIFPLQINNSLKLLSTGTISTNANYHSEHNLFPIGFKSIRTHYSIFKKGQKCEYLNEILEGNDNKPLYRVTCSEDPDNPIIKDSSTGCWVYICQKVNQLQDQKKEKVTISGTERFGLLEHNINKLLEELPNADLCYKYQFKYRYFDN